MSSKNKKKHTTGSTSQRRTEPTSESELVHRYVNRVIKNQIYHGRIDHQKFTGLEHTKAVSKNLWMDTDFYFSVVFQSEEQKYEFMKKAGWPTDEKAQIQIVNGLELAKLMGIELKPVVSKEFPTGNIDLLPFVLDNETLGEEV